MPDDPLDIIAASYRGIHESTQVIAQATTRMVETQQILAQTQLRMEATGRGLAWLQGVALLLLGLSLLGTGVLVWQHLAHRHDTAALEQAVLTNTQTIAAQTQALLERLRQRWSPAMEPFQDDILTRRLDDLTHQIRMLTLNFSTFQLEQRQQRHSDRWDLAEDTQKTLAEMLKIQQTVLEHQRTINGRLAMYVEQQTAINDRLATTLDTIKDLLERGNGR